VTELLLLTWVFVSAADGDTLTVRDWTEHLKVRLAEVDAPEGSQPYSQVLRKNLDSLCRNKPVEIKKVDVDRYGRTVAHVRCDGVQVNWRQVEDGLAWCYSHYLKHPAECPPREKVAREAKKGLWGEPNPQAPWEFRAEKRQAGQK
jgi:micrococcal nuclease